MKRYIKASLILTGIAIYLFNTSPEAQAKALKFYKTSLKKISQLVSPMPMPITAPANDDCTNATILTVNGLCSFTSGTVDQATQSIAPVSCNGFTSPVAYDVWYKYIATPNGEKITVKGSSGFDAVIVLMDTCGGSVLDCANATTTGGSEILTTSGLTAGNTYFIRVYNYGPNTATTPDFDICVALPNPPPVNDDCITAETLTVDSLCNPITGSVLGATQSSAPDTCGNFTSPAAFDVWYTFVAIDTISVITVQGSLSFDAVVSLRDSCSGAVIKCSDHTLSGGVETIRDSSLIIGHTYYIRVYAYGSSVPSTPDFDICVSLPAPPPAYDDCSGAMLMAIDSTCNYMNGSVEGATQSSLPDSCGSFASQTAYDVWYMFVADSNDVEIKVKGSSSFDAVVVLKDSCNGSTIACADLTVTGGTETIAATGLTSGQTYYVRVYSYGSDLPGTSDFQICIALPPPPPANDDCSGAILLVADSSCNAVDGTLLGSTQSGPADSCVSFQSSGAYDVFYTFVATTTNNTVTVTGSSSFDAVVIVKDSCTGSVIACSDNTFTGGIETATCSGLTIGSTYLVRVYNYGSLMPSTPEFTICISVPPPAPINDDCANAISLTADSTCTNITGTVLGSTESAPADSCGSYQSPSAFDVWYKFIAVSTSQSVSVKGSASFDAVVIVKDSCSGSSLGCSDVTTTGGTETVDLTDLTVGNTYYVRVYNYGSALPTTTDFDVCLTTSSVIPSSVASIESKNNLVSVYPNPATNHVTISLKSFSANESNTYKIMNISGQTLLEGKFAANSLEKEIDLSSFAPGIYNVQVAFSSGNSINKKVVVLNK